MSLLLDALKKAAQEKQQASASGNDVEKVPEKNEIELTLDEYDVGNQHNNVASQPDEIETEELSVEPVPELDKRSSTTSTVSDEALHLLVHKTNKQYRRSQKIIWGSTLAAALFMLIIGGVYYYYIMVDEVESIERKHQIAMRLFEAQSVENNPPKMMVERGVPALQALVTRKTVAIESQKNQAQVTNRSAEIFSIKRSQKHDPLSELLNKAWQAYNNKDYTIATDAYNKVLEREPRNRDALLGKAAIAVKQGEYAQARAEYKKLLQQDPRDQIAIAGLSNLDEAAPDTMSEAKLKFMLQQQPDAAHLHFALGNIYAKQTRWPEAQSEYFDAWQSNNENADYAFNLAVSLDQIGKRDEAKRFYEKSLNLSAGQNINFSVEAVKQRLSKIAAR